jgi:hypothetical protein
MLSSWSHQYQALLDRKGQLARRENVSLADRLTLEQINNEIAG